ncbi:MAG: hypothetical protein OSJ60_09020 [Lachnospiraceae bacterium]|nr:hypothetical protein [Lachnospiraceae bacterium]
MMKPFIGIPNRPKPTYAEACRGKYAYPLPYEICKIRFWKSNSNKYETAVFICSLFPTHELASKLNQFCNSIIINTEWEFYTYSDAIYELYLLISTWKYKEFSIGKEICYPDEFWLYMHQIIKHTTFTSEKFDIYAELKDYRNKWKSEKELYHIIRDLFVNETVFSHYRAQWLDNLELDIYINDYKIGIEHQGIQHFKPMEHWGGENGFVKQRTNDIRKRKLCEQNGVRLIYFYYYEELTYELVVERLSPYIR